VIGVPGIAQIHPEKVNLIFIFVPIEKFGIKVPGAE